VKDIFKNDSVDQRNRENIRKNITFTDSEIKVTGMLKIHLYSRIPSTNALQK
jgi:hypothetical protein